MLTTIEVYANYAYKINKKQTKEKFQMGMRTYKCTCPGSAFDIIVIYKTILNLTFDLIARNTCISHSTILRVCYYLLVLYDFVCMY